MRGPLTKGLWAHQGATGTSALRTSNRSMRHIFTTNILESLSRIPTTCNVRLGKRKQRDDESQVHQGGGEEMRMHMERAKSGKEDREKARIAVA